MMLECRGVKKVWSVLPRRVWADCGWSGAMVIVPSSLVRDSAAPRRCERTGGLLAPPLGAWRRIVRRGVLDFLLSPRRGSKIVGRGDGTCEIRAFLEFRLGSNLAPGRELVSVQGPLDPSWEG